MKEKRAKEEAAIAAAAAEREKKRKAKEPAAPTPATGAASTASGDTQWLNVSDGPADPSLVCFTNGEWVFQHIELTAAASSAGLSSASSAGEGPVTKNVEITLCAVGDVKNTALMGSQTLFVSATLDGRGSGANAPGADAWDSSKVSRPASATREPVSINHAHMCNAVQLTRAASGQWSGPTLHLRVMDKGVLSDTALGRCDVSLGTVLTACKGSGSPYRAQFVDVNDFNRIAGCTCPHPHPRFGRVVCIIF
jgi:hypothetical protein